MKAPYVTLLGLLGTGSTGLNLQEKSIECAGVAFDKTKQIHSFSKLWRNAANPRPCRFFPPHVLKPIEKVKYRKISRDFSFLELEKKD